MANPTPRQHIYRQFDQELAKIRADALALGGMAEEQIELAMRSLREGDPVLAEQVIGYDQTVNQLELDINNACMQILARRQPAARDLRLVVAVLKTITDLERIGDDAKRIARATLGLSAHSPRKTQLAPLVAFSEHAREMLRDALDAFARIDVEAALRIKARDAEMDQEYETIVGEQIANMSADPRAIPVALQLMWIAKALERLGDRCANLCEYTVYYAMGKDIRHMSLEQVAKDLMNEGK
jgi:phosphate transport system protein